MAINTLPATGTVGDEQVISGVTYILTALNPARWKPKGGVTLNTTVTNNYDDSVTVNSPTMVSDAGNSTGTSNIDQSNGNLILTGNNGETITASLFTDAKATSAVSSLIEGRASDEELRLARVGKYFSGVDIYLSNSATEVDASSLAADEYYTGITIRDPGLPDISIPNAYFFSSDNSWRASDSVTGTLLGYQGS